MASPENTVKTRILIISDTHNAALLDKDAPHAFRHPLPKVDVLLHCGDLTMSGKLTEYDRTLDMLGTIDAELKLVIAGNHDISLDERFYRRRGEFMHRASHDPDMPKKAVAKWKGEEAKAVGVTFLDEGTHEFTLKNGARLRVYASPYQPEFCDWAFPYERNEDRFNPPDQVTPGALSIVQNPIPDFPDIDVLMTHGPPLGFLDQTNRGEHVGCQHLLRAASRAKPRLYVFGHIHESWGACRSQWSSIDQSLVSSFLDTFEKQAFISAPPSEPVLIEGGPERQTAPVHINVSKDSPKPLVHGEETLLVNASIMNLRYRPHQAPFIVDIELPTRG